ncbi:MAG TPA: AmmeMemoRadiSam system protein B, partial [Prolixibacteraceae bacterium]|nr:AmmeMemoRadiSam system protein B [Prolixibacteraceae bacterium]
MERTIRNSVYAGKFYPGSAKELNTMFNNMDINRHKLPVAQELIGGVVPHAGYVFSGHHAAPVYEALKTHHEAFDTFVIINPNHTGIGNGNFNVSGVDEWETPLGTLHT